MKTKLLISFFVFSILLTKSLKSRPISYAGGWTIMQMNDLNKHSIHLHFSPSINYSVGYKAEYWRNNEWQFHGAQLNYLLKRFNKPASQANFYIKNGVGLASSDYRSLNRKTEALFFTGISIDWEDRRYFISYENRLNNSSNIDKSFIQRSKFGFAPYVGNYGDLHTWLMLQVEHRPALKNKMVYTPVIRLFKGDYLAETGLNNYGEILFNFIKRF